MGQDQSQEPTRLVDVEEEKSPEQLRAEIEDVREDLGDTAAALAAKTDVKARAREKVGEVKSSAAEKKEQWASKLRKETPAGETAAPSRGSSAVAQIRTRAQQNPVLTAGLGALIGGFLLGRLSRRPDY
jgi:ElaB/YqjD/DUF883 family membrane-anchored ribosome-binding protein